MGFVRTQRNPVTFDNLFSSFRTENFSSLGMDTKMILEAARGMLDGTLSFCLFCGIIVLTAVSSRSASVVPPAKSSLTDGLKVSDNHHYLVDAKTGAPVFI